ncbi:hypothetical protein COY90_00105 [Candidatus Roizmanbacteria bacterium CG_4_10_14_0_8_um_filter_39_9]|uniref:Uncharacterized protein n=1 Tax=Candidatus Roizmanbacteria bacterium CG_4_10_14_0_8_um_filter_39_9 TaxID=1974829 RepID=A0A2M7QE86_9BACT|nr:MAG: hypothetical protein COY90_00105 [Candidatus Roizmanbacteria bacterium CG_4_10_14_0_8_um_filter_39_9]
MDKHKICVSKRQLILGSLVVVTGCFVILINYINRARLYTQSKAAEGGVMEFSSILPTQDPNHTYATDCHDNPYKTCDNFCGLLGKEYGCVELSSKKRVCCKVPDCTVIVPQGGGSDYVKVKLLGNYFPNNIPNTITQLNINGNKTASLNYGRYVEGDVVSLLPKDHNLIKCKGVYLGDIEAQKFNDSTVRTTYMGHYNYEKTNVPLTFFNESVVLGSYEVNPQGSIYNHLSKLCGLVWHDVDLQFSGNIEDGCNFTTVVKTGEVGGEIKNRCEIFSTVSNAYSWISGGFVADNYGSDNGRHTIAPPLNNIKTMAIAVLSKTEPAPSLQQMITDLCPNQ